MTQHFHQVIHRSDRIGKEPMDLLANRKVSKIKTSISVERTTTIPIIFCQNAFQLNEESFINAIDFIRALRNLLESRE